ncbi:esterase/lipase family protein [Psychrobacter sp. I-STPA6b]|uniref:esterase/lipase family protein n=1 Tax=Psychrobacter sp. I-STPA6b TaxID=2585718 RepID=UPI001D0BFAC3|nr:alpha/beta hydrolase [Psychrobacter sp. I-STPA6b]
MSMTTMTFLQKLTTLLPIIVPSRHTRQCLCALTCVSILTSCSVVSVTEKTVKQTIDKQRSNIITDKQLSSQTNTTLLSLGIDDQACLSQFSLCVQQIQSSALSVNEREKLALLAELYYAKSKVYANTTACEVSLQRPPIDPYYANAPLSVDEQTQKDEQTRNCVNAYTQSLLYALRYSYAYLFYTSLQTGNNEEDTQDSVRFLSSDLDIQTRDIYNTATNDLIKHLFAERQRGFQFIDMHYVPTDKSSTTSILKEQMQFNIINQDMPKQSPTQLSLYLPNDTEYFTVPTVSATSTSDKSQPSIEATGTDPINTLYSSYEMSFSGLNSISKREGLGVSYVTQLTNRHTTSLKDLLPNSQVMNADSTPESRIHRTGNLLLTGVVIVSGNSIEEVINSQKININLYNPYRTHAINILGEKYALGANFSASYGLWLAENQLSGVGYLNLLARQQKLVLPQLFMLEPYDPNKRVIIMLHGLASSPATWVSITNDIFNDPALRDNYQVWQVFYPTNLPILENRYQIKQLLDSTFAQVDPNGSHPASHHGILVGHSMGAVIGRMLLSNDDLMPKLNELNADQQNHQLNGLILQSFNNQNFNSRFTLSQQPQIDRAVFISAPFKGTNYADKWFTRTLRRIIQLPLGFIQTITGNLTSIATQGELANNPLGALYLQNGASQLSDKSSFMRLTKDISIAKGITYHSIIANQDTDITEGLANLEPNQTVVDLSKPVSTEKTATATPEVSIEPADKTVVTMLEVQEPLDDKVSKNLSDGIVPYQSAHLAGAETETLITGGHSIQESPQAVLTLRKILHTHLNTPPAHNQNQ